MANETGKAQRVTLYSSEQLGLVIKRMACELASLLAADEPTVIIGILRRGAPLADRLSESLRHDFARTNFARTDIKIKRYADDLTILHPETQLSAPAEHESIDFKGRTLVLVDDVLYEGHSMLRALDYFARKQPARIIAAVLADRCVRKFPIKADVVGLRLQVAPGDIVECGVPPYEARFEIAVVHAAPG
jgi:pyrimidine operon attenuation protein / uracil phosphoribosyltransferase